MGQAHQTGVHCFLLLLKCFSRQMGSQADKGILIVRSGWVYGCSQNNSFNISVCSQFLVNKTWRVGESNSIRPLLEVEIRGSDVSFGNARQNLTHSRKLRMGEAKLTVTSSGHPALQCAHSVLRASFPGSCRL